MAQLEFYYYYGGYLDGCDYPSSMQDVQKAEDSLKEALKIHTGDGGVAYAPRSTVTSNQGPRNLSRQRDRFLRPSLALALSTIHPGDASPNNSGGLRKRFEGSLYLFRIGTQVITCLDSTSDRKRARGTTEYRLLKGGGAKGVDLSGREAFFGGDGAEPNDSFGVGRGCWEFVAPVPCTRMFFDCSRAFGDGPHHFEPSDEDDPPLTNTPHQREDVRALDRLNMHRFPTWRVFSGTRLELMTRQPRPDGLTTRLPWPPFIPKSL
ncbi:hypothetical protein TNCV_4395871 [Trichonephila clavipes]|uniref:Uncharacterized protein n=1 Tax=Trichonephila clavipes TaxID=2585209 RepID=A0A8X6W4P8_TRICX|nr:hypothetical protein TNCV_4395871 [Trichonephila clavipes]